MLVSFTRLTFVRHWRRSRPSSMNGSMGQLTVLTSRKPFIASIMARRANSTSSTTNPILILSWRLPSSPDRSTEMKFRRKSWRTWVTPLPSLRVRSRPDRAAQQLAAADHRPRRQVRFVFCFRDWLAGGRSQRRVPAKSVSSWPSPQADNSSWRNTVAAELDAVGPAPAVSFNKFALCRAYRESYVNCELDSSLGGSM